MATHPFRNTILQHLSADVIGRLELTRVDLRLQDDLFARDGAVDQVIFVEEGVGSMTTAFENGVEVEVCMFGYESVVGVSAMMGARRSLNRVFMQIEGWGYRSPLRAAQAEFERGGELQRLALSYVQAQLTQSMQNAACNAAHNVEQRLARWLLTLRDRVHRDTFKFSHEFLSVMLGSTRATVSIAAGALRKKGLLEYSRGTVHIPHAAGLERHACECYGVVVQHLHDATQFKDDFVR